MKVKNIFAIIFLLGTVMTYAQNYYLKKNNLTHFFKIEIFADKLAIGYEIPLDNNKFLLDLSTGIGAANDLRDGSKGIKWVDHETSYLGIFLKGQARYYFNRKTRENKGHSLINNAGSFLGFQSKFNFNANKDIGKVLLNELHFGQQLPLGKSLFFRYHAGVGYGYNFGEEYGSIYPALGLAFGCAF
jgi:hypothetical protein